MNSALVKRLRARFELLPPEKRKELLDKLDAVLATERRLKAHNRRFDRLMKYSRKYMGA